MFRSALKARKSKNEHQSGFRFRGVDNTRIEALSDGVFAIATALLIISSSIPETFSELLVFLKDLVPFAMCMTILMLIWFQHYIFFIRYGFKDATIVSINTLLLFLILFYIYPLKFLFQLLYDMFVAFVTGNDDSFNHLFSEVIKIEDTAYLMVIYGIGAASIFFTLAWMYYVAYLRSTKLRMTKFEVFETKISMVENLIMGIIPVMSIVISLAISNEIKAFMFSGFTYYLYPPVMILFDRVIKKRRKLLFG